MSVNISLDEAPPAQSVTVSLRVVYLLLNENGSRWVSEDTAAVVQEDPTVFRLIAEVPDA